MGMLTNQRILVSHITITYQDEENHKWKMTEREGQTWRLAVRHASVEVKVKRERENEIIKASTYFRWDQRMILKYNTICQLLLTCVADAL